MKLFGKKVIKPVDLHLYFEVPCSTYVAMRINHMSSKFRKELKGCGHVSPTQNLLLYSGEKTELMKDRVYLYFKEGSTRGSEDVIQLRSEKERDSYLFRLKNTFIEFAKNRGYIFESDSYGGAMDITLTLKDKK